LSLWNGVLLFIPAMQARETLITFLLLASVYYSIKWSEETSLSRHVGIGVIFGLLGLVKVIAAPAVLVVAWVQRTRAPHNWSRATVMAAAAIAIVATKPIVNRPLSVPVGRDGAEYAALAYFAGNHPFTSEDQWFNLSPAQYRQLAQMGFHVGERAGEADVVADWKNRYPRIAYCDRVTFETNTIPLVRYNLSHPRRLAQVTADNFYTLFLGKFHHHRKFDTLHLLNDSAYSLFSRILWLALAVVGAVCAWSSSSRIPKSREALMVIGAVMAYFIVVYTIMIGTTIYSIPLVPYLIILQSVGLSWIWLSLRRDPKPYQA